MNLNTGPGRRKDEERTRLYPAQPGEAVPEYSNGRAPRNFAPGTRSSVADESSTGCEADQAVDEDMRKAAVFAALDGVLTSFAIVAGATGGGLGTQAVLILGISSIFADGLSMGLGEYLSSKAMNEYVDIERRREQYEMTRHRRQGEVDTLVELYTRRGMTREDAREVISRLAKYDTFFLNMVITEELGLPSYAAPLDEGSCIREGLVTFASFASSGVLPLIAYLMSPLFVSSDDPVSQGSLFFWACLVTAVSLFAIGAVKAKLMSRSWFGSGMETLVLGGCCAGLAYEIGAVVSHCVKGMV